jgi:sirohydrochlorin ferrochelatase
VPRAAPALVLAVPAAESAAAEEIVSGIASVAALLCPGVAICAGYAGQGPTGLASVLDSLVRSRDEQDPDELEADGGQASRYAAVVVPLALSPDPRRDSFFARIAAQAGPAVALTPYLSPHPVLGGALHDRLAEAGLVHSRRISGLSLVTLTVGVLVIALGGEPSQQTAEAASIMLAARLGMPVAPACLSNPASIDSGFATLRQSGATHIAIAPYAVGPEFDPQELNAIAATIGAQCAAPVGAHPAIGKLVTMRYGSALLEPTQPAAAGPSRAAQPGGQFQGGAQLQPELLDRIRSGLVSNDLAGGGAGDGGAQPALPDQNVQMGGGLHDGQHLVERVEVTEQPLPSRPAQRQRGFVSGAGPLPDHRGGGVQPPVVMDD